MSRHPQTKSPFTQDLVQRLTAKKPADYVVKVDVEKPAEVSLEL